jgi:hypothetical protein
MTRCGPGAVCLWFIAAAPARACEHVLDYTDPFFLALRLQLLEDHQCFAQALAHIVAGLRKLNDQHDNRASSPYIARSVVERFALLAPVGRCRRVAVFRGQRPP